MPDVRVIDTNGKDLVVGAHVHVLGDPDPEHTEKYLGVVTRITDMDVDWSDEAERAVATGPRVSVKYEQGGTERLDTTRVTRVTWADYPDGPDVEVFEADVEVVA